MEGLTPTQLRLFRVLEDGLPHTVEQLMSHLDMVEVSTFRTHISCIRKLLQRNGLSIHCTKNGGTFYRLVRHIV